MQADRKRRVETLIAQQIATLIISGQVKDPRVTSLVSVSRVKVAGDMSTARVGVSGYMDPEHLAAAVEALNHGAGYIQSRIGRPLGLRATPRLSFVADEGVSGSFDLIREMERDE